MAGNAKPLPTFDAQVLEALRGCGRNPSYVLRNHLSMQRIGNFRTDRVLAALKRLEARGFVQRAPTAFLSMIGWEVIPGTPAGTSKSGPGA